MRSPIIWVTSLMYGVSPQPAQAPENSNSGRLNWLPLMVPTLIRLSSTSGRARKVFQFFEVSVFSSSEFMAMARARISVFLPSAPFLRPGQTVTHRVQPQQSEVDT